ncbi:helix-hairpin-helix domain-containing protein [Peterkaempfera sp. SMS 1(5)a]|uniref:helix-hairpin-helix domain-containing protein n=1 Tax=Peterkaempfera podocarpi TaxID=3232308 RepID=UPI00366A8FEF
MTPITTMTLPAARRRETAAIARSRLPAVLPLALPAAPGAGGPAVPSGGARAVADARPGGGPGPALGAPPARSTAEPTAVHAEAPGAAPFPEPPPPDAGAARGLPRRLLAGLPTGGLELDRRAVAGLAVLLLVAVGYGVQHFWLGRPQSVSVPVATGSAAGPGPTPAAAALPAPAAAGAALPRPSPGPAAVVVVDVAGRVRHPGLRTLPRGSRVADALRAAGGPVHGADTAGLNLARILADGEQILVGTPAAAQPGAGSATGPPIGPVSLNAATVDQLDALPGVGPVLARHIIEYRGAHGGFTDIGQLHQVPGIGDRKYAEIQPLVML